MDDYERCVRDMAKSAYEICNWLIGESIIAGNGE